MGLEASKLTVADILAEATPRGECQRASLDLEATKAGLMKMGVSVGESDSAEDLGAALGIIQHVDFWRNHSHIHPNKKRIKAWMFVHDRFRRTSTDLAEIIAAMEKETVIGDASSMKAATTSAHSKFQAFQKKIQAHGDFEDSQLFNYFKNAFPEAGAKLDDLTRQHGDGKHEEAVEGACKELLEAVSAPAYTKEQGLELLKALSAAVKAYSDNLTEHLQQEERVLVHRWLNLSPEEMKTYRSYLSGKYRLVYG